MRRAPARRGARYDSAARRRVTRVCTRRTSRSARAEPGSAAVPRDAVRSGGAARTGYGLRARCFPHPFQNLGEGAVPTRAPDQIGEERSVTAVVALVRGDAGDLQQRVGLLAGELLVDPDGGGDTLQPVVHGAAA